MVIFSLTSAAMFFVLAPVTVIVSIAFAIYVNACAFRAFELFRFANCGIDVKYPIIGW